MKPLSAQMGMYSAYHRHPVNRAIHFVGIPMIVWSLMLFLGLVDVFDIGGLAFTLAHVAVFLLLAYYILLDFGLGVASVVVFTVLLVAAMQLVVRWETMQVVYLALALQAVGWGTQFVGHGVWEKRRPALVSNLTQAFIAPIFLVAETAFSLGMKQDLHADVREAMKAHLPTR